MGGLHRQDDDDRRLFRMVLFILREFEFVLHPEGEVQWAASIARMTTTVGYSGVGVCE